MRKKCLWILQAFMMVAILSVSFTACKEDNVPGPDSGSDPGSAPSLYDKLSEDEKKIVGAWDPDGIDENWDSYSKWIFLADHTCEWYFTEKDDYEYFYRCNFNYRKITEKKTGVWEYNSLTKQLTTTINGTYWIISLMTDDAWTGTSANYGAVTYKRNYIEFAKYYLRKFGLISSYYNFEFNLKDDVLKAEEDAAPVLYKDIRKSGGNPDLYYYEYSFANYDGDYYTFPGSDSYIIDYGFNVTNLTSKEIQCKIGLGKYYEEDITKYERQDHGYWVDKNGNYTEDIYDPENTFIYDYREVDHYINSTHVSYFDGTLTLTDYYTANPKLVLDGQTMQTKKTYKKEISLSEAK